MTKIEHKNISFWGIVCGSIISGIFSIVASYILIIPKLPSKEIIKSINVSADVYPFTSTNIELKKDDEIWFFVEEDDAHWDCTGSNLVGPNGYFDDKRAGFQNPSANFCELVGYIRDDGNRIRIGSFDSMIVTEPGLLYLGANDDPSVDSSNFYPFYLDNTGQITVKILIKRK